MTNVEFYLSEISKSGYKFLDNGTNVFNLQQRDSGHIYRLGSVTFDDALAEAYNLIRQLKDTNPLPDKPLPSP